MNRKKELCRNFQRGSCQYGDRCKFLHQNQQQSRPTFGFGQNNLQSNNATTQQRSNPFGFGVQSSSSPSQQQKPNPFGFGVQSNTTLNQQQQKPNPFGFGVNANTTSAKPFENKWTRNSSPSTNLTTQKTDAPAASHKCTDPESCKSQIIEDFKNEAPLWKLTCYGHLKYGPCDIVGDISYEELRSAAYDDAKKGLSLQSIVERERSLYVAKMNEFDKLLKSPYGLQNQTFNGINGSPMTINSGSNSPFQTNSAPSFSSFGQTGTAANLGSNISINTPGVQGSSFGAPSFFGNSSQNFNGSQMKFGTADRSTVGENNQISASTFGNSSGVSTPATSGLSFGAPPALPFASSSMSFGSKVTGSPFASSNQQLSSSFFPNLSQKTVHQSAFVDDEEEVGADDGIWLKEVWNMGEIPDRAPPARLCL